MYKLMNDYETIMECSSKIFLEKLSKEIERHHPAFYKYRNVKSADIKTEFDEELKKQKSHITYLENKLRVIEYELKHNLANNHELNSVKEKLTQAKTIRETIEVNIEGSKTNYRAQLIKDIPEDILELFNNHSLGFGYILNLSIDEE